MTKIVVFILLQLALNIELFSQEIALKSTGNHHLLFSGLSHWNTTRVSNISGSVDKVRTATTLGFVFDIGYKYIGSRFSANASLGHGFYNEEVLL